MTDVERPRVTDPLPLDLDAIELMVRGGSALNIHEILALVRRVREQQDGLRAANALYAQERAAWAAERDRSLKADYKQLCPVVEAAIDWYVMGNHGAWPPLMRAVSKYMLDRDQATHDRAKGQAPQSPEGPAEAAGAVAEPPPKDVVIGACEAFYPSNCCVPHVVFCEKRHGHDGPHADYRGNWLTASRADASSKAAVAETEAVSVLTEMDAVRVLATRFDRRELAMQVVELRAIVTELAAYRWLGAWCPFCKCSLYGEPKHADDCLWCRAREASR